MARPISDKNRIAADIITTQMTADPTTTRKAMLTILVEEMGITKAAAGYYIDRACRHVFVGMQQKQAELTKSE